MRRWIEEGRVSADSLVWREGWADWKSAGPVFPTLQQETPEAVSADSELTPATSGSPMRAATRPPGKKSVATVVILGLVIVVLFSVLFIVLQNR